MKYLILLVMFFSIPIYANSSVSFTVDVSHFKGDSAIFIDTGPFIVSTLGLGAEKTVYKKNHLSLGIGAIYLYQTNQKTGTNWNITTTLRYRSIIYRHISHGSLFGIEPNKANAGYNFVGLEFEL